MTPPPDTPFDISPLAEALRNELDILTNAPRRVTLFSGEHVGSFAEKHYYRFEIPEHVILQHLTAIQCSFGLSQPLVVQADVVAVENQYLTLAFPFDFGAVIPEVSCTWDYRPSFQPVIDSLSRADQGHSILQRLLKPSGGVNLHAVSFEPDMLPDMPGDQKSALKKLFQNRVSFVWGPILSGKTHLLAHIASNYIKAGKTVLFVATMNERVDDVLLRSIEIGEKLGVEMATSTCCLGLPAVENFEKLGALSFDQQLARKKAEKKRSFQERVSLLETWWRVRIKQMLHEDDIARIGEVRERISEKKRHLEKINAEMASLKETISRVQNASMMDRLKKGFGKEDLALAQRKLQEQQAIAKQLQSLLTSLTQESLRREAHAPLSGEELQKYNLAVKRIEELGGISKVEEAVGQYTGIDEKAELESKRFIGTTLINALSDPLMAGRSFDMVMVDDAESISIPFIAALSLLSKGKIVVCGDPFQLGPDCLSNSPLAEEWLKHDIFLHVAGTENLHSLFDFSEKNSDWCILLSSHFASTPKLSLFVGSVLFDDKINVFASPKAKGRIFFVDTSALRSQAKQYLGRKKILPHNDLHTKKVLELVKHSLMEPGRKAMDIGVIVPFPGPSLYTKQQLRMSGIINVEVGIPSTFRGRRKRAVIFDTVAAGVDHTIRPIDDKKVGEHQIVRLLNTALSCVEEDLYVLADLGHLQTLYQDRLLTKLLMLLKTQSDPLVNFSLAAKNFDELEWDKRAQILEFSGTASSTAPGQRPAAREEDLELSIRMKLMAKKGGVKIEGQENNQRETYHAVNRILGLRSDISLIAQYVGGDLLFRHSLSTEKAVARIPLNVCLSEREFQSVMDDWNLLIYEKSGGLQAQSALLKAAPETKVRGDINALKAFYSTDVESALEEGKQKLAMAVSKIFQESLGKPQPGNPQEWSKSYLFFLSKLEAYLTWVSEQLRK
jgi:KaiC/GvpD/RAD55 family RecA-like ATPase